MGKSEQGPLFVTADAAAAPAGGRTILCPCLGGLPPEVALAVGILPIHDANARALSGLETLGEARRPDFVGLNLVDPFRRLDDLLDRVAAARIQGVVNLPTVVPFLDGDGGSPFRDLHDAERRALDRAAERGFETLFVVAARRSGDPRAILLEHLTLLGGQPA